MIFLVVSIVFTIFTIIFLIRVSALGSENYNLTSEIDSLTYDVDYLTSEVNYLINELDSLRASKLHRVNFHYIESGSPPGQTVNAKGAIFNSGTERAYNVVLTIFFYDDYDTLLKSEEIQIGTIYGKNYQRITN